MQLALNLPNPLAARDALFTQDGRPFVTSRELAARFGKAHKNVLRAIDAEFADPIDAEFNRLNFVPITYLDRRGRAKPEYRMTRSGFEYLVGGFTGRKAKAWRLAFIRAFDAVEAELRARTERFARAFDQVRPHYRRVVELSERNCSRQAIAAATGLSPAGVTYRRRMARQLELVAA